MRVTPALTLWHVLEEVVDVTSPQQWNPGQPSGMTQSQTDALEAISASARRVMDAAARTAAARVKHNDAVRSRDKFDTIYAIAKDRREAEADANLALGDLIEAHIRLLTLG